MSNVRNFRIFSLPRNKNLILTLSCEIFPLEVNTSSKKCSQHTTELNDEEKCFWCVLRAQYAWHSQETVKFSWDLKRTEEIWGLKKFENWRNLNMVRKMKTFENKRLIGVYKTLSLLLYKHLCHLWIHKNWECWVFSLSSKDRLICCATIG